MDAHGGSSGDFHRNPFLSGLICGQSSHALCCHTFHYHKLVHVILHDHVHPTGHLARK